MTFPRIAVVCLTFLSLKAQLSCAMPAFLEKIINPNKGHMDGEIVFRSQSEELKISPFIPLNSSDNHEITLSEWPNSTSYTELGSVNHVFGGRYQIVKSISCSRWFKPNPINIPDVEFKQPIVFEGKVAIVNRHGDVVVFDESIDYRKTWKTSLRKQIKGADSLDLINLTHAHGYIFATLNTGDVIALDSHTGEIKWQQNLGCQFRSGFKYSNGFLYGKSATNMIFSLDPQDGTIIWSKQQEEMIKFNHKQADLLITENTVISPYQNGDLVSYSKSDGETRWIQDIVGFSNQTLFSTNDIIATPIQLGETIIAGITKGGLYSISLDGQINWEQSIGVLNGFAASRGFVFFIDNNNRLIALHYPTGAIKWMQQMQTNKRRPVAYYINQGSGYRITNIYNGSPIIIDDQVVMVDGAGSLYVISIDTGNILKKVNIPYNVEGVTIANQTIYLFSSRDQKLIVIK